MESKESQGLSCLRLRIFNQIIMLPSLISRLKD